MRTAGDKVNVQSLWRDGNKGHFPVAGDEKALTFSGLIYN